VNWVDLVLGLVLIIFVAQGFAKGFTRQVIHLIATLAGLLGGIWFYRSAAEIYVPYFKSESMARFFGFLTIFIGVQLAGALVAWVLSKFVKTVGLSWLDRLLGGAFGIVQTALTATGLVLFLTAFPFGPLKESVAKAWSAPYVFECARIVTTLAPQELKDAFRKGYDEVQKFWKGEMARSMGDEQRPDFHRNFPAVRVFDRWPLSTGSGAYYPSSVVRESKD